MTIPMFVKPYEPNSKHTNSLIVPNDGGKRTSNTIQSNQLHEREGWMDTDTDTWNGKAWWDDDAFSNQHMIQPKNMNTLSFACHKRWIT